MVGKLVRGGVAALSAVAIVVGGAVVGAGTASAQSDEQFVTSVEQRNLTASSEWTPEQWIAAGLNLGALPLLLALDAVGSVDVVVTACPGMGQPVEPCTAPPTVLEQLFGWAEEAVGS
jgi:hypothetical protein